MRPSLPHHQPLSARVVIVAITVLMFTLGYLLTAIVWPRWVE